MMFLLVKLPSISNNMWLGGSHIYGFACRCFLTIPSHGRFMAELSNTRPSARDALQSSFLHQLLGIIFFPLWAVRQLEIHWMNSSFFVTLVYKWNHTDLIFFNEGLHDLASFFGFDSGLVNIIDLHWITVILDVLGPARRTAWILVLEIMDDRGLPIRSARLLLCRWLGAAFLHHLQKAENKVV